MFRSQRVQRRPFTSASMVGQNVPLPTEATEQIPLTPTVGSGKTHAWTGVASWFLVWPRCQASFCVSCGTAHETRNDHSETATGRQHRLVGLSRSRVREALSDFSHFWSRAIRSSPRLFQLSTGDQLSLCWQRSCARSSKPPPVAPRSITDGAQ